MSDPQRGGLTPEQKEEAAQAARDAIWHDDQIERLSQAYDKAKDANDFDEMTAISGVIDAHKARADEARKALKKLGFG
jgi:protein-disulfide isomerase-like protein with CxxC motif